MIKTLRNLILTGIVILVAITLVIALIKPSLISEVISFQSNTGLSGKCLAREKLEKFEDSESLNMIRVIYEGDTKYLTLHYSSPSLMNQFMGSYDFENFGKDELINDTLLINFKEVPCKDSLKIKALKQHRDYNGIMEYYNLKSIQEKENGSIEVNFQ